MNILMSVGDARNASILSSCFQRHGCVLKTAYGVDDLYCAYVAYRPPLVVLDGPMYSAAREVLPSMHTARTNDEYFSILLLAEHGKLPEIPDAIRQCIDILDIPCDPPSAQVRIDNALKSVKIFHKLILAKKHSSRSESYDHYRNEMAKGILEKMASPCRQTFRNIKHFYRPSEGTGGDILLVERAPDGNQFILLGDITGHGIAASLAALPITQSYGELVYRHGMLESVVKELNVIACEYYPEGIFAASAMIELHAEDNSVKIWNGGVPDILILRNRTNFIERVSSSCTPLGLTRDYSKISPRTYLLEEDDAIYVYTDGLIDAANSNRVRYGSERLETCLLHYLDPLIRFDKVYADFLAFTEFGKTDDDVTFVEVVPHTRGTH